MKLEKRVEKLEEAVSPTLGPEQQQFNEELRRKILEGRERVRKAFPERDFSHWDEPPLDAPPPPTGKVDIAAVIRSGAERAQRLREKKAGTAKGE